MRVARARLARVVRRERHRFAASGRWIKNEHYSDAGPWGRYSAGHDFIKYAAAEDMATTKVTIFMKWLDKRDFGSGGGFGRTLTAWRASGQLSLKISGEGKNSEQFAAVPFKNSYSGTTSDPFPASIVAENMFHELRRWR